MGNNDSGQLGNGTNGGVHRLPELVVSTGVTAIAAGFYHSIFVKNDGGLWGMGNNLDGQLGDGTNISTNRPKQILAVPGYNRVSAELVSGGEIRLSFVGIAGSNYALEHTFGFSPATWQSIVTNTASAGGLVVFPNVPGTGSNNFWRVRSVP
jgi:hypothetical protein